MSLFGLIPFAFQDAYAQSGSTSSISAEAGALQSQQPHRSAVTSSAFSLFMRRSTARAAASANVLLAQSNDSSAAAQVVLGTELAWPSRSSFRLEGSGSKTWFGAFSAEHGTSASGYLRQHYLRNNYGTFGTLGAGSINRDRLKFHSLAWDVGAWARNPRYTGVLTMRQAFTNDYPLLEASGYFLSRHDRHYSVRDFQFTFAEQTVHFEGQVTGTLRHGLGATTNHSFAWHSSFTAKISPRFALSMNTGEQLADLLTGVPSARILGASLRVNFLRSGTPPAPRTSTATSSPYATQIQRHALGGATVTVRVNAPANARVELSGSFNDWNIITVARMNDKFETVFELPGGTHRVAIRVNGGMWFAPVGLASVKDDLGGAAGLIVVP